VIRSFRFLVKPETLPAEKDTEGAKRGEEHEGGKEKLTTMNTIQTMGNGKPVGTIHESSPHVEFIN
jgi:hypothetical protein